MEAELQGHFFETPRVVSGRSGSFVDNMKLPVHRWFRYSAGFSADWVEAVIREAQQGSKKVTVLDPFAGSGTALIAAEQVGVESFGAEAHPFVVRVARAKLSYRADPLDFLDRAREVVSRSRRLKPRIDEYPPLIRKCFGDDSLYSLAALSRAVVEQSDDEPASLLCWLALVGILRSTSHVGTAPWQYVLPTKSKRGVLEPREAFAAMAQMMATDMASMHRDGPPAALLQTDARTCEGVPDGFASLVITSPPYANNYDYADATRLEQTFLGEIEGWSDLQTAVRKHLVRSCSQHVTERSVNLDEVLSSSELSPIADELHEVCSKLGEVRMVKGGKKNYHLMAACYFADMAKVWIALRRTCAPGARVCFVIGDSAPYGVYLPVVEWMGALAQSAGFGDWTFEKFRDRNIKWKNRKHRVPLLEGRLWVNG